MRHLSRSSLDCQANGRLFIKSWNVLLQMFVFLRILPVSQAV